MDAAAGFVEFDRFRRMRRQENLLNGEEVIFAVRIRESICRITIGVAEDIRYTVGVTQNLNVVVFGEKIDSKTNMI